ncbi:MAG: nucleoside-diphosphate kinase [Deltaproteobacteria bacterium]|nr:nucleoside-diphosphate kinase [Deltaproteobacteria bacterium]
MAVERTLSIIKPNAVEDGHIGAIVSRFEQEGFRIVALRMEQLTRAKAEGFYAVHRERPFFNALVTFMTRSKVVLMVLERDSAISHYREVIGATDPAKAKDGTIRKLYGKNVEENAVHGSDAPETARFEIGWFFTGFEVA